MNVGLDSGFSETPKIFLSVSVVAIIAFRCEPPVNAIAVSHLESAGVGCGPRDSLAVGILREKACALQTDLRPAFLSHRAKSQENDKTCKHDRSSSHRVIPPCLNVPAIPGPIITAHESCFRFNAGMRDAKVAIVLTPLSNT